MDKIIKAVPIGDYRIEIQTSSGISGIFDVKPYLNGSAFKELVNESYFRTVHPAHHGMHGAIVKCGVWRIKRLAVFDLHFV